MKFRKGLNRFKITQLPKIMFPMLFGRIICFKVVPRELIQLLLLCGLVNYYHIKWFDNYHNPSEFAEAAK